MFFHVLLFLILSVQADNPSDLSIIEQDEIMMTINRDNYQLPFLDKSFINQSKVDELFTQLRNSVYTQPKNALINDQGDIIKEKLGQTINKDIFLNDFYAAFYNNEIESMNLKKDPIYPKVDSELLSEISQFEIGMFVTHFQTNNKERTHNIDLATQAINSYVVFPGQTFSFNRVVGERTVEKGYKKAPVIVKGELSEDIGGGICQVSSTLFNAVNIEGIQILERYSHSRSVPYVPPGKDAAVSWLGPDFTFKNNLSHPVLIRAKSLDGTMRIHIYSSQDNKNV